MMVKEQASPPSGICGTLPDFWLSSSGLLFLFFLPDIFKLFGFPIFNVPDEGCSRDEDVYTKQDIYDVCYV